MLLVIVVLVLMAMIGATYLQVTRVQRAQAGRDTGGDINAVVDSVLGLIATTLEEDVRDPAGNLLNPNSAAQADEPYDYPWTNLDTTAGGPNEYQVYQLTTGAPAAAYGGHLDDKWLASSSPVNFAGTPSWPNITDLTGVFLGASAANGEVFNAAPTESAIDHTATDRTNVGLNITSNLLVDVDQDGIKDSRWAFPPIPLIEGSAYTMAVRIVDLGGRLNIATATSPSNPGDLFDTSALGVEAPHWTSPTELNFGTFSSGFGGNRGQLDAWLAPRFTTTGFDNSHGSGPNFTTFNDRLKFWEDAASVATPSAEARGELNLLVRNGLDDASFYEGAATWRGTLPALFRNGGGETAFGNFPAVAPTPNPESFFKDNPRQHATLVSGISSVAAGANTAAASVKINLNDRSGSVADFLTAVSNRVTAVAAGTTPPLGLTAAEFGDQFAANLLDYIDPDNFVTQKGTRYGLEALPFIAEVYVVRPYLNTAFTGTAAPFTTEWAEDGEAAYAIEIANPFRKPILLSDIQIWIEPESGPAVQLGATVGNGDLASIIDAATGPAFRAFNLTAGHVDNADTELPTRDEELMLWPGDSIVLYHDPGSAAGLATLIAASGDVFPVDITTTVGEAWPDNLASSTPDVPEFVQVSLRASTAPGTALTFPYQTFASLATPATVTNAEDAVQPAPNDPGTSYISTIGTTEGINMLALPIDTNYVDNDLDNTIFYPSFNLTAMPAARLGLAKTGPHTFDVAGTTVVFNALPPGENQVVIYDDATTAPGFADFLFTHVGEVLRVTALGFTDPPTGTITIPDSWGTLAPVADDIYLGFSTAAPNVGTPDPLRVPLAAALLDQFTLYEEPFVPGVLNLNTASVETLERSLPLTDPALRQRVAQRIVGFRDNPTAPDRTAFSNRRNPGVAMTGELAELLGGALTDGPGFTGLGYGGDTEGTLGTRVDFQTPGFTDAAGVPLPDDVADDREEELFVTQWLSQVASTRSDCFAAYIWVREYEAGDFTSVTDERRLIAVFQRNGAGVANLLGVLQTAP